VPKWTHIVVHHTGTQERSAAQVKAYHKSLGWRDVGYHYIIERDGKVVSGRPPTMEGAHCVAGGMNRKGIGVCLIGNFELYPPPRAQLVSLRALLQRLMREHRVPPANVLGHGEVPGAATACPGRHLDLKTIREALSRGPVLYRVQVGAFSERGRAEAVAEDLRDLGYEAHIVFPQ